MKPKHTRSGPIHIIIHNIIAASFFVLGAIGIVFSSLPSAYIKMARQSTYIIPPKEMVHFSFGFEEAFASLMWVRLLQDIDICEQSQNPASYNSATTIEEILDAEIAESRCNEGWVYHMLDRITDFSPKFLYAYVHGGLLLSVVVDDREGARQIFEKGLKMFPDHYNLNYHAAYHYLAEIREPGRAAQLMKKTHELGGPAWLSLSAARLFAEDGMKEAGIMLLNELIETNTDPEFVEAARERLNKMIRE